MTRRGCKSDGAYRRRIQLGLERYHGELCFENRAQNNLPVFLEPGEKITYHATKVVHNCLLPDRLAPAYRRVAADLAHGGARGYPAARAAGLALVRIPLTSAQARHPDWMCVGGNACMRLAIIGAGGAGTVPAAAPRRAGHAITLGSCESATRQI
jgi:hypothetical protein